MKTDEVQCVLDGLVKRYMESYEARELTYTDALKIVGMFTDSLAQLTVVTAGTRQEDQLKMQESIMKAFLVSRRELYSSLTARETIVKAKS